MTQFEVSNILAISLSPAILMFTSGILDSPDPFIPKLPYDKAVMSVNRIDAFRIGSPGRGLFSTHTKPCASARSYFQPPSQDEIILFRNKRRRKFDNADLLKTHVYQFKNIHI